MPVKNAAKYLEACLDSIINQSYRNWTLYAVDDHSSDSSYEILINYAAKDNRLLVLQNSGSGIIDALQSGYKECSGSYITRMDADDIMASHKLESMHETLQSRGRGYIVVGLVKYFNEAGLGDGYRKYEDWLNTLTRTEANFDEIYKECTIPSPCWMIHRKDFDSCGAFNAEIYPEDYDLAFRMRKANLRVAGIPDVLHHWRDYPERTSRNDPNYSDNRFTQIKVHNFLNQDFDASRQLVLWGAGNKGKAIAKELSHHKVSFSWITDNEKKINKSIYDIKLDSMSWLNTKDPSQVIVGLSSNVYEEEIHKLKTKLPNHSFFLFS